MRERDGHGLDRRGLLGMAAGVAWALALLAACGGPADGAHVAEVDGRPIRVAELRRMLEARHEADPEASPGDVLTEELDRLVNERVAQNRAEELGIQISDSDVENWIRMIHGDDFVATDTAYREEVRRQIQIERAAIQELAPTLRIPESALADFFEAHKGEYSQPERIQLRQIVVEDRERATKLLERLRAGENFEVLARDNSQAPEAVNGGLIPPFARGELPEIFDQAFGIAPGQLSDVFESPHGYHIFLVIEKYPPQTPELAEVREELMARVAQDQLAELRPQWLRDLRRSAQIQVHERLLESLKR